jgi:hypothetical protein
MFNKAAECMYNPCANGMNLSGETHLSLLSNWRSEECNCR